MTTELINELRSAAATLRKPFPAGWTPASDVAAAELLERAAQEIADLQGTPLRSLETAPNDGVIRIVVEGGGERRTFVAEASFDSNKGGERHWMTTGGWTGWGRMHSAWTPIGWLPLASDADQWRLTYRAYTDTHSPAPDPGAAEKAGQLLDLQAAHDQRTSAPAEHHQHDNAPHTIAVLASITPNLFDRVHRGVLTPAQAAAKVLRHIAALQREISPLYVSNDGGVPWTPCAAPAPVSATTQTLIDMLVQRDQAGRAKYGATLDRTDLAREDWLQHMAEELLDGAGYALAAKRGAVR